MSVAATRPGGPRHQHSPRVRRLATEHGVDLGLLTGSGPNGRTTQADVLRAAAAPVQARSQLAIGQVQIVEVDLTRLSARGSLIMDNTGSAPLVRPLTVFIAKATLEALQAFPQLGGSAGLALAVDTVKGRLMPVLTDARSLNLSGLARRLGDLVQRVRSGQLAAAELTGHDFALLDSAGPGILVEVPVLTEGQRAVLSAGIPAWRPVVVHGEGAEAAIAIRLMAYLTLDDQGLIGHTDAAGFLGTVKAKLESGLLQ